MRVASGGKGWTMVWRGEELLPAIEQIIAGNMAVACEHVRGKVVQGMKPGTGRIYFRRRAGKAGGRWERLVFEGGEYVLKKGFKKKRGGAAMSHYIIHQASAPGQPPAPDTGTLKNSITWQVLRRNKRIVGRIGTGLPQGAALEFGTKDGRIKARPYIRPVLRREAMKVQRLLGKGFRVR